MSLISGWFPVVVVAVALATLLALVPWERRPRAWRVAAVSVGVAGLLTAAVAVLLKTTGAVPWGVPWTFYLWAGLVVLAPVLTVVGWRDLRWRRLIGPLALVVCAVAAVTVVNRHYDYIPTGAALFDPTPDTVSAATLQGAAPHDPHHGEVVSVAIPGRQSHFQARDADVWVPPVYFEHPGIHLPVLELLGGSPGAPIDWIRSVGAATTADAYAVDHGGVAPLIVMPDLNGSYTADTECIGASDTYITDDVPYYMHHTFGAAYGTGSLGLAGLSEGGTCAALLPLLHPGRYSVLADYSGLDAPSVSDGVDPAATTAALFGGSTAAYDAHDPLTLLREGHDRDLAAYLESGGDDATCIRSQDKLAAAAQQAGVAVTSVIVPGAGHDYALWSKAFSASLSFLVAHLAMPAG